MDYTSLIHSICDSLIEHKDALIIRSEPSENPNIITLLIVAEETDTARLIGKKGCVANAIRDIVSIAGSLEKKKIYVKFESLNEKGE